MANSLAVLWTLASFLHCHGDLELDSVDDHFGRMAMVEGGYTRDKNTCARTLAENVGGAYTRGGAYMRDTTVITTGKLGEESK